MKPHRIKYNTFIILCCPVLILFGYAENDSLAREDRFVSIVLGTAGGLTEGNLSSYLLVPHGSTDFIALDAGTLLTGLQKAKEKGSLADIAVPANTSIGFEADVLHHHIRAYLLSHSHLDHLAGLVINSPDDSPKEILGLSKTIDVVRDHLFNWKVWPNLGNEGNGFQLKKYHYVRLTPGEEYRIKETSMSVIPFELCHSGVTSTAFLIQSGGNYVLYMGDTGPDEVENCDGLRRVWHYTAPLVREGKLGGIFLEISYPDPRNTKQLYGHLTPLWAMKELKRLAEMVNPQRPAEALKGLKVVVTHIKPSLDTGMNNRDRIRKQVDESNQLGINFIFPQQGERIAF